MRRREFLATLPWTTQLPKRQATGEVSGQTVSIKVIGSLHPRAWRSVNELMRDLRQIGYSVTIIEAPSEAVRGDQRIVVAVAEESNQQELRRLGWQPGNALPPECFELRAKPGGLLALGADSRAVVYALSQLLRSIKQERRLPSALALKRQPLF